MKCTWTTDKAIAAGAVMLAVLATAMFLAWPCEYKTAAAVRLIPAGPSVLMDDPHCRNRIILLVNHDYFLNDICKQTLESPEVSGKPYIKRLKNKEEWHTDFFAATGPPPAPTWYVCRTKDPKIGVEVLGAMVDLHVRQYQEAYDSTRAKLLLVWKNELVKAKQDRKRAEAVGDTKRLAELDMEIERLPLALNALQQETEAPFRIEIVQFEKPKRKFYKVPWNKEPVCLSDLFGL